MNQIMCNLSASIVNINAYTAYKFLSAIVYMIESYFIGLLPIAAGYNATATGIIDLILCNFITITDHFKSITACISDNVVFKFAELSYIKSYCRWLKQITNIR